MSTPTTHHKRVNVSLPADTIRLIDRVVKKGGRSRLIDEALHFYVKQKGRAVLRKALREGALARAPRDQVLAEEWFAFD